MHSSPRTPAGGAVASCLGLAVACRMTELFGLDLSLTACHTAVLLFLLFNLGFSLCFLALLRFGFVFLVSHFEDFFFFFF